jgi:hypothetical protein
VVALAILRRRPLTQHDEYMRNEYGDLQRDLMAFMIGEMKIDKYLTELENKSVN